MPRTYSEMIDLIEAILIDGGINPSGVANQVFATAELDEFIKKGLVEVSKYAPYQVKTTLTTEDDSRDLTLTDGIKHNLLWIEALEYQVDQNPRCFRNWTRFGDTVSMEIDYYPEADEDVYLYLAKKHILQKEIGTSDTAGVIKTLAAAGATSLVLKSLGTGTINEETTLAIAGEDTEYEVIETATIGSNEATVKIFPALAVQAAADAVVTLSLHNSTLSITLEDLLADMVSARAAINKSRTYIGGINIASANTASEMLAWGQNKLADTLAILRHMAKPRKGILYSRA